MDLFSKRLMLFFANHRYRDPPSAREAIEKLNGFEVAGRAIRVGLGNDKFTNDSTQAILDRYDNFRGTVVETTTSREEHVEHQPSGRGYSGQGVGNLDDTDIAGVSFQSVSRQALMKKLAREEPQEKPEPYAPSVEFDLMLVVHRVRRLLLQLLVPPLRLLVGAFYSRIASVLPKKPAPRG
jgi:linker between RRM2 and RRM3 domains in RBM39 protein